MPKITKPLKPGDEKRTITSVVEEAIPVAERTPACLLDPLHWATRPADRNGGPMPVWEFEHRSANRRPVFKGLLASIQAECDVEWDAEEWHTDEAFHPCWIPLEQLEKAIALIPEKGFSHTLGISKKFERVGGEYLDFDHLDGNVPVAKLMIIDTVVWKLRPAGYNCRTLRGANADGVQLALLNPRYWDTDPNDTQRKYLSSDEQNYRCAHRREVFTTLLDELEARFDLEEDYWDWGIDESLQSYFIPLSQVADAHQLIAERGFDYEASENTYDDFWEDEDATNLWVQDPVVSALIPKDYNYYTMRSERVLP